MIGVWAKKARFNKYKNIRWKRLEIRKQLSLKWPRCSREQKWDDKKVGCISLGIEFKRQLTEIDYGVAASVVQALTFATFCI